MMDWMKKLETRIFLKLKKNLILVCIRSVLNTYVDPQVQKIEVLPF